MSDEGIVPDYPDFHLNVLSGLQRVLQFYTKLPADHPFIVHCIAAAKDDAAICAGDLAIEEDPEVNYTEESLYLYTYAEAAADIYRHHMQNKMALAPGKPAKLTDEDYRQIMPDLIAASNDAINYAGNTAEAVINGEMEPLSHDDFLPDEAPRTDNVSYTSTVIPTPVVTTTDASLTHIIYKTTPSPTPSTSRR